LENKFFVNVFSQLPVRWNKDFLNELSVLNSVFLEVYARIVACYNLFRSENV